jgi:integrase
MAHKGKDERTYRSLRFSAYGKRRRVPLGTVSDEIAQRELRKVLSEVENGDWQPNTVTPPAVREPLPSFHAFAEEWWTRHEGQITPGTQADYRWRLQVHLVPFFGPLALDAITFDTVERYIAAKLAGDVYENGKQIVGEQADPLSPRSINMHVTLLAAILERAVERELIAPNPAKGKGRRVRERAPQRSYLDAAGQIVALLDAGGVLDRKAPEGRRHIERRAMLATLTFAGLRISELCALRWRDVDLAQGWLHTGSKTDAGVRKVKIRGALRDELLALRGRRQDTPQAAYVFATLGGGKMSANNFRGRVLKAAVKLAGERLEGDGLAPLPAKMTPHSLRRTFCSLLYALGEDPGVVMDEMGHTDPGLALRVYRQAMRRSETERDALRDLVEGGVLANSGQRDEIKASGAPKVKASRTAESSV